MLLPETFPVCPFACVLWWITQENLDGYHPPRPSKRLGLLSYLHSATGQRLIVSGRTEEIRCQHTRWRREGPAQLHSRKCRGCGGPDGMPDPSLDPGFRAGRAENGIHGLWCPARGSTRAPESVCRHKEGGLPKATHPYPPKNTLVCLHCGKMCCASLYHLATGHCVKLEFCRSR